MSDPDRRNADFLVCCPTHAVIDGIRPDGPRDVMTVPKGFRYAVSYDAPARVLVLNDVAVCLERAARELRCREPFELRAVPRATDPHIARLMRCLHAAARAGGSTLYRDVLVQALAIHLIGHYAVFTRKARVHRRGVDDGTLRRAREYVDANLHTPIRLHDRRTCHPDGPNAPESPQNPVIDAGSASCVGQRHASGKAVRVRPEER